LVSSLRALTNAALMVVFIGVCLGW
jgi:hypothetical protein